MTTTPETGSETGIETAGTYYQGWLGFTKWASRSAMAIAALLVVLAITLV